MKKYLALGLVFLSVSVLASGGEIDCENAYKTYEINQCAAIELEQAQKELAHYLEAALKHSEVDSELVDAIQSAQADWEKYYESHCHSVYTQWRGGTIRGVMGLSCKTALTKQHTHEIWESFLAYMDNTPAVLPEPER